MTSARRQFALLTLLSVQLATLAARPARAEWQAAKGPLTTPWTDKVSPENSRPEYPRPQLVRDQWTNLNGLWDYAIVPASDSASDDPSRERERPESPKKYDGQILVPFPIESALSGVKKPVKPEERLWYRRTFDRPKTET